jgi:Cdc6-like AAA superfamily ATPase
MADVFISYRQVDPDQKLAAELGNYLGRSRISHFIDTGIRIGQKWIEVIDRELRTCKSLVVLLSSESIRSDMVRHEVKLAHELKKQLFPVRVDYDGALPHDLGAYLDPIQYTIWRSNEPFDPICGAILDGMRQGSGQTLIGDGLEQSSDALRTLGEITELRGAPLPSADPRLETGGLKLDSPFYVRRATDETAERLVRRSGETILIKGPRQVGKTSLAARARATAEKNSQKTCYIDFQLIDESRLRDSSALFKYLAARLAKEFQTTIKPNDVWDDMLGDADSLTDFIEQAVLPNTTEKAPILLCLDEVDNVFKPGLCTAPESALPV